MLHYNSRIWSIQAYTRTIKYVRPRRTSVTIRARTITKSSLHHSYTTMIGMVYVKTPTQLRRIEKYIFELLQNHLHVHILNQNHKCGENRRGLEIFIMNQHPSIKCIFASKKMLAEFNILSLVLEGQYGTGLHSFCPVCGQQTI